MEKRKGILNTGLLIALTFLSLLPNLGNYEFRGEESLRVLVAWEMVKRGEFFQTYFLGEPYFNKPPLFNWLIVVSSGILGWGEEALRVISITSTLLTSLLTGYFSYLLTGNIRTALISSLVFVSFADILFWYGWLGEIDATFTLVIFSSILCIYLGFYGRGLLFTVSGFLTALGFLLKGLPAYVFFFITLITCAVFMRKPKVFISGYLLGGIFLSFAIPLLWLFNTRHPDLYLERLVIESFSRVESSENTMKFLKHLITYPLLNLKQTLPASLIVLLGFVVYRKGIKLPSELKLLSLIAIANYVPYILSAGSRGRYILPLFPMLAVIIGYILSSEERLRKVFLFTALTAIVLRLVYGFALEDIQKRRGSVEVVAEDILSVAGEKKIACDCVEVKSVCLYLNLKGNLYVKRAELTPEWTAKVSCSEEYEGNVYRTYKLFGKEVKLIVR